PYFFFRVIQVCKFSEVVINHIKVLITTDKNDRISFPVAQNLDGSHLLAASPKIQKVVDFSLILWKVSRPSIFRFSD
ncbi:hypothetical protein, partial [Aggregatibacter actinomycetemcomitans]